MDKKIRKKILILALIGSVFLILWIGFLIWYLSTNLNTVSPQERENLDVVEQGKSDQYFSGEEKEFFDDHPWYSSLPQSTEKYFLFYHPLQNVFIADIYLPETAEQNEINQIKSEISNFLRSQGVELGKFKVIWNLVNKPNPGL